MTDQDLVEIEARVERAKDGLFKVLEERTLVRTDVPALVTEVRRLQALLRRSAVVS